MRKATSGSPRPVWNRRLPAVADADQRRRPQQVRPRTVVLEVLGVLMVLGVLEVRRGLGVLVVQRQMRAHSAVAAARVVVAQRQRLRPQPMRTY